MGYPFCTNKVRARFAPSPTGLLHIGNARTAIMNWLFDRHREGRFILRIEDTDRERSTEASETSILEDLKWLGLNWDEGPDVGGEYGPYRQSKRLEIYQEHIRKLQEEEKIYPCYCSPEELEIRRQNRLKKGESAVYDGHCRTLSRDQRKKWESEGRKPAYRFRVEEEQVIFDDLVRGPVSFQSENIGDFILIRPDGLPMYNFACVVDDHFMNISHVVRGDDHVSNTPRQVLLYQAFGWRPPAFAHIPMILGEDRMRMSKRHGATSVVQYRELGYLPEALVNFLSLLSWSSQSGEEILSLDQLIEGFDFGRISKSSAVFDVEKLDWMNGVYIRKLDVDRFTELIFPLLKNAGFSVSSKEKIRSIALLLQEKVERLTQISEKAKIFFQEEVLPENADAEAVLKSPEARQVFLSFLDITSTVGKWEKETFNEVMKRIQKQTGIKGKQLWMPIRVALTGQVHGPELPGVAEILGLEKCRQFVEKAFKD